jgi:hypothetical protein
MVTKKTSFQIETLLLDMQRQIAELKASVPQQVDHLMAVADTPSPIEPLSVSTTPPVSQADLDALYLELGKQALQAYQAKIIGVNSRSATITQWAISPQANDLFTKIILLEQRFKNGF